MSNELSPGGGGSTLNASQILAKLTGATTLAVGALLFGAGTALLTTLPPAANGLFLSLSGGVPTWSINPAGALPASYAIGDTLFASSASALSRLAAVAVGQVLVSNGVGVAPSWSASPSVTGIITAKPTTTAGIALDPNAATGNFLLSLSPAGLTAARRWSFPDRSDTVAGLSAQTFTGAQTINGTITGLLGLVILGGTLGGPANLELGNVSGTATTPYIDFNTSATAVDYNVRLIASGAASGLGAGTLTVFTSSLIVNVDPGGNELLRVGGGVSALGPVGSRVAAGLTPTLRLERSSVALWDAAINASGGYEIIQTSPRLTISISGSVTVPGAVSTGQLTATGVLSSLGTITTAQQVMDSTVTWNAGAVAFTGIKLNVTDTASAAGSLLLDLQVGGVSKFSVRKDGLGLLTLGGLAYAGANNGELWHDSTQKNLSCYLGGIRNSLVGCIFTSGTINNNTTAETSMFASGTGTKTLPANSMVAGKLVRVRIKGALNHTSATTIRIKASIGSLFIDTGAITLPFSTGGGDHFSLEVEALLVTPGVSADWRATMVMHIGTGTTAYRIAQTAGSASNNTTISNNIDVTATWGAASNFLVTIASIEILN